MRQPLSFAFIFLGLTLLPAAAQETLADLIEVTGMDLSQPDDRARIVARMAGVESQRLERARAKAAAVGLPIRSELRDGRVIEIHDFDGPQPLYLTTHNVNAAISTGASLLQDLPYGLNGGGITIGMWDGGSGRASHQEFGSRMVVKDGSAPIDHATHVGGTMIASGVTAAARGMATAAVVDTYDWNNDISEMTNRGATAEGQEATRIYLSNHSYGFVAGWLSTGSASPAWRWYGDGTTASASEQDFGRYNSQAREIDALAYNAPYYLIFQSAGNDRSENPATGQTVGLSPSTSTFVSYDPALHPPGDGKYRNGFETISFRALAKNVVTVGAVNDAVTSGSRDISKATMGNFSSWGPTDDGRIKPDLVANGVGIYSPINNTNTSYATYSGTSMSSPNACGSAALLVEQFSQLFPGKAMRAATLKSLLIHTADDLGNPGPDYKFGWGLINVKEAADLLIDHHANPVKLRMTEDQLTTSVTTRSYPFLWDGESPIRATLSWTDPAGTATSTSDLRTPRLVNNLDLKLIAPDGSVHLPYVMPFVGTWTVASMDLPATTGVNNTDNVEQVYVESPDVAGTWQAVVSYSSNLTNNQQHFALMLDGSAAEEPPTPPVALSLIDPATGLSGSKVTVNITGTSLGTDTVVKLARSGHPDIPASSVQLIGETIRCQFDLSDATTGSWNLIANNADGSSAALLNAFTVIGAIWSENFDNTFSGWSSSATTGSNQWTLSTTKSQSPTNAYFAPAPSNKTTTYLVSPSIPIPSDASDLQFKFWHDYNLQNTQDAGRLEFSVNGEEWFIAGSSGSGTTFASGGYNTTINATGRPMDRNEFAGQRAWSGNSGGFIETIVNFTDNAKFAGIDLRARWCLSTNASTASPGWYVDSISLVGGSDIANEAPVITAEATSSSTETETDTVGLVWHIERSTSTTLTVEGSTEGGEDELNYLWNATGPAPVFFTPNGSNAAQLTAAEFEAIGDYTATVTVTDSQGLAITSSVNLRVVQTASGLLVNPGIVSLLVGESLAFSALLNDQFGDPMDSQLSSFAWEAANGGTIDSNGLFTATTASGPFAVSASNGDINNFASVTVNPAAATITLANLSQTYDGSLRVATATTEPNGLSFEITYDGSATPPVNAGSYPVEAVITNPNYQGGDSGTLGVAKALATVTLAGLSHTYDGKPKTVTTITEPADLTFEITYDGLTTAPVEAGQYEVVANIIDPNYQGLASGTLLIEVPETIGGFTLWQQENFTEQQVRDGLAEDTADPDGDGLPNFAEYALGTDPWKSTALPASIFDENGLSLTFTRPAGLSDVIYGAESSEGFGPWTPLQLELIDSTEGVETLRAMDPLSNGDPSRRFIRLRFTRE